MSEQTVSKKLDDILLSKNSIKEAILEKTGENPGDVLSEYANIIKDIETGNAKVYETDREMYS